MKLVSKYFKTLITWSEGEVPILKIENKNFLGQFLFDISRAYNVSEECFRIYNDHNKDLSKRADIIFDPFNISPDNPDTRKFITEHIKTQISLKLIDLSQEMLPLWEFFEKIILDIPLGLILDNELVPRSLASLYKVEIEDESESLLELIVDYIKTMVNVSNKKIFVFLHLKHYLSQSELKDFYDFARLEEVDIFLIESTIGKTEERERLYVLDEDLCEIS